MDFVKIFGDEIKKISHFIKKLQFIVFLYVCRMYTVPSVYRCHWKHIIAYEMYDNNTELSLSESPSERSRMNYSDFLFVGS
jgi:hypothetical protein